MYILYINGIDVTRSLHAITRAINIYILVTPHCYTNPADLQSRSFVSPLFLIPSFPYSLFTYIFTCLALPG